MMNIQVTFKPVDQTVAVEPGTSLLAAALKAGIRLKSDCGGMGRCGKCKVVVSKGVSPLGPRERDYLTPQEVKAGVRLACQAFLQADTSVALIGMLPEKECILEEGINRPVAFDPAIRKQYLSLTDQELKKDNAIADIIETLLAQCGNHPNIGFSCLKALPDILGQNPSGLTAILNGNEVLGFEPGNTTAHHYGLAVDIGTTTVVGYLYDLSTGKLLGVSSDLNRQSIHGSDVVTRIEHAINNGEGLRELQKLACDSINRIIEKVCTAAGVLNSSIYSLVFVGNTPMNHLFWGLSPRFLSRFPYNPITTRTLCVSAEGLGIRMNPVGRVFSLPLISGFIGSDTVGVVLSTGIHKSRAPELAIDIGTNGEIVLTDGKTMLACATAAGPAFEGAHIQCGMRGASGAIDHVVFTEDDIHYDVIDEVPPKGICGSGLVDAVAEMLKVGLITPDGKLLGRDEISNPVYARRITHGSYNQFSLTGQKDLPGGSQEVVVTQKDIRELQLAKGAMLAGIQILMDRLGLQADDIRKVYLAGAFGNYIRPGNAVAIGLLPALKNAKIIQVGNAAGSGAKMALLSQKAFSLAQKIADRIKYVEIAKIPEFQDEFIEAMTFPASSA